MTSLTHTLSSLSEKATQGEWSVKLHRNGVHADRLVSGERTIADVRFKNGEQDAAFIVALVNTWRSGRLRVSDELDAATVERCAQVAERWLESSWRDEVFAAKSIASAIRSLIPDSANEIHSSDGGAKVASSAVLASEEDQSVAGTHGVTPVGNIAENPADTDAGPSEVIPSSTFRYGQYDAKVVDPAVTQDCAPAGTVSEEASEPYGWFEPITPELGGSLVERFRKGAEKPFNWSEFAFPLFRLRRMR